MKVIIHSGIFALSLCIKYLLIIEKNYIFKVLDSTFESEKSGYIRRKSFMTRHIKDTEGKLFMVCLLVWNQGTITHYITSMLLNWTKF